MKRIGIKKTIALTLHDQIRKNLTRAHELTYLFWECTLRCNLQCIHCGSDCLKSSSVPDMPMADFLKAIDDLLPHIDPGKITIGLTGGEPLMRLDLEEIGLQLYKRGFAWGFVTNGILLNKKRLDGLLNSGLRVVTLSLDGLKDNHNWLRGTSNAYYQTLKAIELVSQSQNLMFDVVTCVNRRNINELDELKNELVGLKVWNWRLFTIFPRGRAKDDPELQLSDKMFVQLMEFIKNTRAGNQIHASYGCEGFLGIYEHEVRDSFFYCRAGINVASILADGSIAACPSIRDNFIQGNIYTSNFYNLWNNQYQAMRDRSWTKTGKCKDCKSYKYCRGNGLHLWEKGELLTCHLEKINNGLNI